jgi:hypothetical protein
MNIEKLFTVDNAENTLQVLRTRLKYPFISCYASTLGSVENISILLCVSEQLKENWQNNILENSPYRKIHISNNGEVETICNGYGLNRMRKFKINNIDKLIEKLNNLKTEDI